MLPAELTKIDDAVSETRQQFLHALDYDFRAAVDEIAERFLAPFAATDASRSALAVEFAHETEALLRQFTSQCATIAQSVALANMWLQSALQQLTLEVIQDAMGATSSPPFADPLKRVVAAVKHLEAAASTLGAAQVARAVECGRRLATIQSMAAGVVNIRAETMRKFREENLSVSPAEIVRRLRHELREEEREQLKDAAWEGAKETLEELFSIVMEEEPLTRVRRVLERLAGLAGGKEPDTSGGGTDVMLGLLGQLRLENRVIADLSSACDQVIAGLAAVAKPRLPADA